MEEVVVVVEVVTEVLVTEEVGVLVTGVVAIQMDQVMVVVGDLPMEEEEVEAAVVVVDHAFATPSRRARASSGTRVASHTMPLRAALAAARTPEADTGAVAATAEEGADLAATVEAAVAATVEAAEEDDTRTMTSCSLHAFMSFKYLLWC